MAASGQERPVANFTALLIGGRRSNKGCPTNIGRVEPARTGNPVEMRPLTQTTSTFRALFIPRGATDGTIGCRGRSKGYVAEIEYALSPMAPAQAGAVVRRMIGRPKSSLFASLLVLFQLLVSPLSHAAPAADDDCDSTGQTTHVAGGGATDCGDCPDEPVPAAPGSSTGDHHCRTHVACSCPCAHTPALGSMRLIVASPTPPESVTSVLTTPVFDAPLFDFLRPPN